MGKHRTRKSSGKRKVGAMQQRLHDREMNKHPNPMIVARRGEADKQNKLIDKYERKYTSQKQKNDRLNIMRSTNKNSEVVQEEKYKRSPKLKKFDQFVKDAAGKKGQEKIDGMNKATKIHKELPDEDKK